MKEAAMTKNATKVSKKKTSSLRTVLGMKWEEKSEVLPVDKEEGKQPKHDGYVHVAKGCKSSRRIGDTAVRTGCDREGGVPFRGILDQVAARKIHPNINNVVSRFFVLATRENKGTHKQNQIRHLLIVHNIHKECLFGKYIEFLAIGLDMQIPIIPQVKHFGTIVNTYLSCIAGRNLHMIQTEFRRWVIVLAH